MDGWLAVLLVRLNACLPSLLSLLVLVSAKGGWMTVDG
jgi:hypothetical protein